MNHDRIRAVWECELDRLELDVIRTERVLRGLSEAPIEPWDPPAVPGQMPADLAARARDLLDRQQRAREDLSSALATAQRQIGYADHLTDVTGPGPAAPVYLDLEA